VGVGVTMSPELDQLGAEHVAGLDDLAGLGCEQLSESTGRKVAKAPAQVRGRPEVGSQLGKELLRRRVEDSDRVKQVSVLEDAQVDRLQRPENGDAVSEQLEPHVEVVANLLLGVQRPGLVARLAGGFESGVNVIGDAADEWLERGGESGDGHGLRFLAARGSGQTWVALSLAGACDPGLKSGATIREDRVAVCALAACDAHAGARDAGSSNSVETVPSAW